MTTMNLTKFTPYPGSPVYRELYGTNIRDDHWEKMNGMNFIWAPDDISVETLDREYQKILLHFYQHPKIMHKYILMSFQNPTHLKRLGRFLLGFFKAKIRSHLNGQRGLLLNNSQQTLSEDSL
jgi:hypothetical protein